MTFNLPLALVYARILAVVPIVLLLQAGGEQNATWAFLVFCLAALSDDLAAGTCRPHSHCQLSSQCSVRSLLPTAPVSCIATSSPRTS